MIVVPRNMIAMPHNMIVVPHNMIATPQNMIAVPHNIHGALLFLLFRCRCNQVTCPRTSVKSCSCHYGDVPQGTGTKLRDPRGKSGCAMTAFVIYVYVGSY